MKFTISLFAIAGLTSTISAQVLHVNNWCSYALHVNHSATGQIYKVNSGTLQTINLVQSYDPISYPHTINYRRNSEDPTKYTVFKYRYYKANPTLPGKIDYEMHQTPLPWGHDGGFKNDAVRLMVNGNESSWPGFICYDNFKDAGETIWQCGPSRGDSDRECATADMRGFYMVAYCGAPTTFWIDTCKPYP